MDLERLRNAALELGSQVDAASARQSDSKRARAFDPEYWSEFETDLQAASTAPRAPMPDDHQLSAASSHLDTYGYCSVTGLMDVSLLERLGTLIQQLNAAGWPPLFAVMFDDLWRVALEGVSHPVIERLTGTRCSVVADPAVHFVPQGNARGWLPHRDGDGSTGEITMWVPITDATLENGCIYVIPRSEEVAGPAARFSTSNLDISDTQVLLQHARALPSPAGSALFWHDDVIHWGSVSRGQTAPRLSLAVGWTPQEPSYPLADETSTAPAVLRQGAGLPSPSIRVRSLAIGILTYHHQEPRLRPFVEQARERV